MCTGDTFRILSSAVAAGCPRFLSSPLLVADVDALLSLLVHELHLFSMLARMPEVEVSTGSQPPI